MKRIIALFILMLSFTLVIFLPAQAADFDLVADGVGVLTDDENSQLNELAQDISNQYQCEMSIVIIDDKGDDGIIKFTKSFYNEYGYGYGEDMSGMMLLISMSNRDYALVAYGYGNTVFTDHGKNVLEEKYLLPMLAKDEYYSAFSTYLNQTAEFLEMAGNGTPFDVDTDEEGAGGSFMIKLAIVIFVPLLIAGLICFMFLSQMKTAVSQRAADNYIPDGSFNLTMQADQFLYRTETRRKIEKESSNGGTSVSSDGSSSSSGKF